MVKKTIKTIKPLDRPDSLPSMTYKISTGNGKLYVTVTYLNQRPFEVFCSMGKSGYSIMANAEAIGRLISLALRSGISIKDIANQLKGIGGSEVTFHDGSVIQSIPDAIAFVLEKYSFQNPPKVSKPEQLTNISTIACPICTAEIQDEKCPVCPNCAWTKCSGI